MSAFDAEERKVESWLAPLDDPSAPCGPDLEYDNEFLAVMQAAAGKPESQFGPAELPEWRRVVEMSEALLDRTRDLRIAVLWLRANLHLSGYGMLPTGLRLINGLLEVQWERVHPLPDPDDGDPYARVNTLTLLREPEGLLGDLRETHLIRDRSIGELSVGNVSAAMGLTPARPGEADLGKDRVMLMLSAAVAKMPELTVQCQDSVAQARRLIALANDKLGSDAAPDLRPLYNLVNAVAGLLPTEGAAVQEEGTLHAGAGVVAGPASAQRGLSGGVNSRDEAMRAIDMVCEYLERTEPTNPAPLFLRRARQLVGHNFLQLLKELAPDALHGVATMVGVDPEGIESPNR
jgi:type VI secretion system protein ImpA